MRKPKHEFFNKKIKDTTQFIFPFTVVISTWQLLTQCGIISENLIPSPLSILYTIFSLLSPKPLLLIHLWKSVYRLTLGYSLGVTLGILIGVAMGINKSLEKTFSPIISFFISIPTIAWVPLFLILLGLGDETIITAIFLGSFFPVIYNTLNGVKSVKKELVWASEIMGANQTTITFKVLIPGSLTSIIAGLRLATGYAWRALVGAEMLAAAKWGIGYMIYAAKAFYEIKVMFAGLVIIAIGGLLLDHLLMGYLEKETIEKWGLVAKR